MSKILLIDSEKRPLYPIHPARSRQLLRHKKAAIFRRFPFTLILKESRSDAAAVNTTRLAELYVLKATGLPVEVGSGGLTKFNRCQQWLEKTHWLDADRVGISTPKLIIKGVQPLLISARRHGSRQSCGTDRFGFPKRHVSRTKFHFEFQTGDIVKAVVTKGKKIGTYVGRIETRATGSFDISTADGLIQEISHRYCQSIHKKDGYGYVAQTLAPVSSQH